MKSWVGFLSNLTKYSKSIFRSFFRLHTFKIKLHSYDNICNFLKCILPKPTKNAQFFIFKIKFFLIKIIKSGLKCKNLDILAPPHFDRSKNNFESLLLVKFSGSVLFFLILSLFIIFSFPISLFGYMRRGLISGS